MQLIMKEREERREYGEQEEWKSGGREGGKAAAEGERRRRCSFIFQGLGQAQNKVSTIYHGERGHPPVWLVQAEVYVLGPLFVQQLPTCCGRVSLNPHAQLLSWFL